MRPVEREIGYRFRNGELVRGATHTWHRCFGPLEHLGDAVADLAVGITCHRVGVGPEIAARIVDNAHLDSVMARRMRRIVRPRTGDVIEALVGAVHLDSDIDHAARVTVRLLMPDTKWRSLPDGTASNLAPGEPTIVWLGALALDAVIADHLIRRRGPQYTSQRELSRRRSELVSTAHLTRLLEVSDDLQRVATDARGLKSAVARTLLDSGWSATCVVVTDVLGLSGDHAVPTVNETSDRFRVR